MTREDSLSGAMLALNLDVPDFTKADIHAMDYASLAQTKLRIENSLEKLFDLLTHTYRSDMTLPLTIDGFPRADIDVLSVRLIRTKVIRLRNDLTDVIELIGTRLEEQLKQGAPPETATAPSSANTRQSANRPPFARVDQVFADGPADRAGLKMGDLVVAFDADITFSNHNQLSALATRVQQKKDQEVPVEVIRLGQTTHLVMVPSSNWSGRGLLGCHLVPL